ncbi:sigma-54-dependent Fis family transcriptional regulator [Liquorilactobacillus mali]|uniref:Transcriptional regulator AcoR n=1 Tax=Liquorilactobacillus mali TaxID=1618 RepID=A0A0R2FRB5_9LACO|nr:sigma-54-dependent Fis family transcriptional regulator [Liquorilactobacillus mali]KRN27245.1 transcriptional regulator AcoR [Liquorilactobacillus mali]MDN7146487.1 sigma-54-dependent Fis family transcriptional regulator [Liquorilactobacillus mali]
MQNQQLWENFIAGNKLAADTLDTKIADSWKSCLRAEIDPYLIKPQKILSAAELFNKQQQYSKLIEVVREQIKMFETNFILEKPVFILTDGTGNILWRDGNLQAQENANEFYFREGTMWTELNVGTNAIGIAIRTKQDEHVTSEEHYAFASRQWSCSASPILDEEGDVLGILDISTLHNDSAKDALFWLTMLTQRISNTLIREELERRKELLQYCILHQPNELLCDTHFKLVSIPEKDSERYELGNDIHNYIDAKTIYKSEKIYLKNKLIGYKMHIFTKSSQPNKFYYPGVPTTNKAYSQFLKRVLKLASSNLPIHLFGESGTGKEVLARTIHYNSAVGGGPLIALNCGALNQDLLESELFGYAPGAFTGSNVKGQKGKIEQADGGTLFLDEIESMSMRMQTALLRVIEEKSIMPINGEPRKVSFRLITASNLDLRTLVQQKKFREDLFYRIYVCPVQIPPLRERMEDIRQLIVAFCKKKKWHMNWQDKLYSISCTYSWDGNIREFNNFLERLYLFYELQQPTDTQIRQLIEEGTLAPDVQKKTATAFLGSTKHKLSSKSKAKEAEKLQEVLEQNHYHISKTADELCISRTTLYRKMKKYGLK